MNFLEGKFVNQSGFLLQVCFCCQPITLCIKYKWFIIVNAIPHPTYFHFNYKREGQEIRACVFLKAEG